MRKIIAVNLPVVQGDITEKSCLYTSLLLLYKSPVCILFIAVEEDDSDWPVISECNL